MKSPVVNVTTRQLNRTTLGRQGLLKRSCMGPEQAVRQLVGLQAQDSVSPYVALWNRLESFDAAALDKAFTQRTLVKSSLMRITLHVVSSQDFGAYHAAMEASLRSARVNDKRFLPSGLTEARIADLLPSLRAHLKTPRTEAEMVAWLAQHIEGDAKVAWWGLRYFAGVHRTPTGGPWSFLGIAYEAPRTAVATSPETGIETLLLDYLSAFGPASSLDFARFTLLRSPVVQQALKTLGDRLERLTGPNGEVLWDVAGLPLVAEDTPAPPRLLPMWDNIHLGHVHSRLLPPAYRGRVVRVNGDILPTLLVDGEVAGVWRVAGDRLEAAAFHPLSETDWQGVEREANGLLAFLRARETPVFSKGDHWWNKGFETAERRTF